MEQIGILFGSMLRVRVLRLFLFNKDRVFTVAEVASMSGGTKSSATQELGVLHKAGIVRKRKVTKKLPVGARMKDGTRRLKKVVEIQYRLWQEHSLVKPLETLFSDTHTLVSDGIARRFKKAGPVKLVYLSGIFVENSSLPLDVLIVGDKLDEKKITHAMRRFEIEMGRELRYAVFDAEEFAYRLRLYDQLVCDTLNGDHVRIVDALQYTL